MTARTAMARTPSRPARRRRCGRLSWVRSAFPTWGERTSIPSPALASVTMLSRKIPLEGAPSHVMPTYASRGLTHAVSRYELPDESMDPDAAYQLIHDELALDANPALNLATFVTTYMDPAADRLMG